MFGKIRSLDYLKLILSPWDYNNSRYIDLLKSCVLKILNSSSDDGGSLLFIYENGRTGEYEFLKALDLPDDSNIVIQGFTCNAVVNPVLWLGLKPKYVDIDPVTLNMSMEDLREKVDVKTKVIIVQHTFGRPGPIKEVMEFARKRGIYVLEDCAHAFGGVFSDGGRKIRLGKTGDAAIFSFGLEKVFSTRVGGALLVNNSRIGRTIGKSCLRLRTMSRIDTFKWLMNPVIWRVLRKLGEKQDSAAESLCKIGVISMGSAKEEYVGKMPKMYPRKLSGALAKVVLEEVTLLGENLEHRRQIARIYSEGLAGCNGISVPSCKNIPYVRFPVVCESGDIRDKISEIILDIGYRIGNWYNPVVYPSTVDVDAMMYKKGMCPVAEGISSMIINLPTGRHISMEDARMMTEKIGSGLD